MESEGFVWVEGAPVHHVEYAARRRRLEPLEAAESGLGAHVAAAAEGVVHRRARHDQPRPSRGCCGLGHLHGPQRWLKVGACRDRCAAKDEKGV